MSSRSVPLSSLANIQYFVPDPEDQVACLKAQIEIYKEQIEILKDELKYKDRLVDRCVEAVATNGRIN